MKKRRILSIACILSLFLMAGCAGNEAGESSQQGNKAQSRSGKVPGKLPELIHLIPQQA